MMKGATMLKDENTQSIADMERARLALWKIINDGDYNDRIRALDLLLKYFGIKEKK